MSTNAGPRPLVSAVVPTRNRAKSLGRALDSILTQKGQGTLFELEIIVVDDASSDDTPDVIQQYAGVRYLRLEQQRGAAAARNVGIKASTGRYVAFQDDDDEWLPEKLQVQARALEDHPEVGVVYGQSLVRHGDFEFLWPDPSIARSGFVFRALVMTCFCAHPPALLIRRDVFAKVGGFDEQLRTNEDYDLWLRIAFHFPFLFVPGAVAVRNESAEGLYYSTMSRSDGARDARVVVERALRMLPGGRRNDALRQEARLRTELHIVLHGAHFSAREERWRRVLDAVRRHPEILHYRWGRGPVAMNASAQIVDSSSPLEAGRKVSAQLSDAASGRGLWLWLSLRLTLASVWTEAAQLLRNGASRNIRAATAAAARAAIYNPSKLRKKAVLSSLFQAFLPPFT